MNKNKLSRFLLSTSVGIITTLGISEVHAFSQKEYNSILAVDAQQAEDIDNYTEKGAVTLRKLDPSLDDATARKHAASIAEKPSGLAALYSLGDDTDQLFAHFKDILLGGIRLTPEHFESFLSQIADASTLKALGVDSIIDLKSPELEYKVAPDQITTIDDAKYFAEQRKNAGEFEVAAQFFLKARDLTDVSDSATRKEYAENALLMYSEHFIHYVALISSVTEENVTAAQTLLASVKALAEETGTTTAFLRAASCAEELGTAINDFALKQIAARDLLTDATLMPAADAKIATIYVSLYNADIIARDMHQKVANLSSGQDKNSELVAAADAMRLAIGALADAYERSKDAIFSGSITVLEKLNSDAIAFNSMYTDLADNSGDSSAEELKTSVATAKILSSKYTATWNARSKFATTDAEYTALDAQYTTIGSYIDDAVSAADAHYSRIGLDDRDLSVRDIISVRSVNAEKLYRVVLDAVAVDTIVAADVATAVTALETYVTGDVIDVVNSMDSALKSTLDEVKAASIRSARTDCNRILSAAYGLVAKAFAAELEKVTGATLGERATRLGRYLAYARLANNKAAWEAGVTAADVLLADADVAVAADDARLVKALALTAKAEALLRRNTDADDATVATVNAGALTAGLLFDANAAAAAMTLGTALHITATDHLRKAFEMAVELHSNAATVQGLRTVWAGVESAFATDKLTVADTALTASPAGAAFANTHLQQQNGDTWAAILGCFANGANAEAVKAAIRLAVITDTNANNVIVRGVADTTASRRAALVANTLAKFFDTKDQDITTNHAGTTPNTHEWFNVEGLFNDLKAEYDRILALDTQPYVGYTAAAAAFEKARKAKADWAAEEVKGLSAATWATWAAKRNAAGAAYTDAANFETQRAGALLSAAGIGLSTAFDTLADITGLTASLATAYVSEDVLTSLHRRAASLKDAATTYNLARAAVGTTEAEIVANAAACKIAIESAVEDSAAHLGAYEIALGLVNKAYQGLAGFSGQGAFGAFAGERLTAITTASRNVMTPWLEDLTATLALATTTDALTHRDALKVKLIDNAIDGTGANTADYIFSVGVLFDGVSYAKTHSALRDIALSYDMVLRALVALGTTAEDEQKHVYEALKKNAELAKGILLEKYDPEQPLEDQIKAVITQLTQRADLAEAVLAAAYGALRSNHPSSSTASDKAARAQAITAMTSLIQEGAADFANVVLKEENVLATADLKAQTAHQLGRLLMAKAASERIRFDNLGAADDKASVLADYQKAIDAYKAEIAAILSQTESALMAGRNTRLIDAYENLGKAYGQAIENGADAALVKDQYAAVFNQAQILYREGNSDRSAEMLEGLLDTPAATVALGDILKELAEQYEAEGKFLEAVKAYKSSTQNYVAQKDADGAYKAAENAFAAAQQSGHSEAYQAAAEAFNLIGAKIEFHGRVRAEAYEQAAEAYFSGKMNEAAATAYSASGDRWADIGDSLQAGSQYEKASWALSKVESISVDQRITIIQAVEKAAHQLQIANATTRLETLVALAEEQIAAIQAVSDSITTGKLKVAVVSAAGAMYEKALAFQKEGDLTKAEAAEARIVELLNVVDTQGKEAGILVNLAKLYTLQKKNALAVDAYIKAAVSFVEGKQLLDAANAYADAANAVVAAGEGNRIKDEILPALLDISASVRAGGANAGGADQFDIHFAVVEVYRDLAKLNPSEINGALAEVEAILKENPTQKDMQARIAGVKISLLSQKAKTQRSDAEKLTLLQEAKAAFDGVKSLTEEADVDTVNVKRYVAIAANELAGMYVLTRVAHTADGLSHIEALKAVVEIAEAAAAAAYDAAAKAKMSFDVALEAAKEAAEAMASYTKGMIGYIATETDQARTDDVNSLRSMPDRMVKIVDTAVRATLLGILKSREEAAVMQSNFVAVLDASNKVSSYVVGLRNSDAVHDFYGDVTKVKPAKAKMSATKTKVKSAVADLSTKAKSAQALPPVARAAATDKLVAEKTDEVAKVVLDSMTAQSTLVTAAPADQVTNGDLANHAKSILETVVGDGTTGGLVADLQSAQGGSTTSASIVPKQGN
jgi:hypothetical protein